ncbi:hypothetical protein EVAR_60904_1 [Eumeta japonica]|uniref:Uncharacterized protein n=1 Tax=Eumeta variegata TaxID=151549 RepID=A0A4C1ZHN4_EUMVA|nr:hypothetical protein EVAR_60904_1 [Eumeta japonica]
MLAAPDSPGVNGASYIRMYDECLMDYKKWQMDGKKIDSALLFYRAKRETTAPSLSGRNRISDGGERGPPELSLTERKDDDQNCWFTSVFCVSVLSSRPVRCGQTDRDARVVEIW